MLCMKADMYKHTCSPLQCMHECLPHIPFHTLLFLQMKNIPWLPQELLVSKVPNNTDSCFSMALLKLDCDTFLLKIPSALAAR